MRFDLRLLSALCLALPSVGADRNPCPDTDLACHDIMNSSQCIEQLVLERNEAVTKDALVKCVEHEGTASTLPGAVKVGSNDKSHLLGSQLQSSAMTRAG
jgi:hypothetical protein